jgi:hypothetical protein
MNIDYHENLSICTKPLLLLEWLVGPLGEQSTDEIDEIMCH